MSGPDALALLDHVDTNPNFEGMVPGQSKHLLLRDESGHLIADDVCECREAGVYRTYWLAPVLAFLVDSAKAQGAKVTGTWITDEYFFQVDGPKSLQILGDATHTNLHDLRFTQHKTAFIADTPMTVHRLGMSGALAYGAHGAEADAEVAYTTTLESVKKFGGVQQGFRNHVIINHTPSGYPNQFQHYVYELYTDDPAFVDFCAHNCPPQLQVGSVQATPGIMCVTPFEFSWGKSENFNHEFVGRKALFEAKANPGSIRRPVALKWEATDVPDVFMSQSMGVDVEPFGPVEAYHDCYNGSAITGIVGHLVQRDSKTIGYAAGRCNDFLDRKMLSIAFLDPACADEGSEVKAIWKAPETRQKLIRARVAQFPYYQGEWRNETCNVNELVPSFKE